MTKKTREKLKYLEKGKSFQDKKKIKIVFHYLKRTFIEANETKLV